MDVTIPAIVGLSTLAGILVIAPTTKFALDISPYLYANTRVAARSGLIFNRKYYEELLNTTVDKEIFALLEDTSYSRLTEHANDFASLSKLLEDDLFKTYSWLEKICPDKINKIIKALKLKFEINDIKELLNNLKNNREIGELKYLSDEELKLKLESIKDFSSLLAITEGTAYGKIFSNKDLNQISEINTALDIFFIKAVSSAIEKCDDVKAALPFKEFWKTIIDLTNTKLIIRKIESKKEDIALVEGGSISIEEFAGINDNAQLETVLSNSIYKDYIPEMKLFDIENAFYKFLKKQAGNIAAKYTVKSGAVVRFIIQKELEIRNLNIVVKLKTENFKTEDIEKVIV